MMKEWGIEKCPYYPQNETLALYVTEQNRKPV